MSIRTKGGAISRHCAWCRNVQGHRDARVVIEACPNTECALYEFRPKVRRPANPTTTAASEPVS